MPLFFCENDEKLPENRENGHARLRHISGLWTYGRQSPKIPGEKSPLAAYPHPKETGPDRINENMSAAMTGRENERENPDRPFGSCIAS